MGIIKKIKELFSAKRYIERIMEEYDREQKKYVAMSSAELLALSDEDLLSAANYRAEHKMTEILGEDRDGNAPDWISVLKDTVATVYTLSEFDAEMVLGEGLAMFFEDDNRGFAPRIAECLEKVGATEHLALYTALVTDNQIDLQNTARFPNPATASVVRGFDRDYRALPSLEGFLTAYIRAHIFDF